MMKHILIHDKRTGLLVPPVGEACSKQNKTQEEISDYYHKEFADILTKLLGVYGNFVNRTLIFIHKYLDGIVPKGNVNVILKENIENIYKEVGNEIEKGQFMEALDTIFEFTRYGNQYFDTNEPWKTRISDPEACRYTLLNCVQIIANLSVLLQPFLPFSSEMIFEGLTVDADWKPQYVEAGYRLPEVSILFEGPEKE